MIIFWDVERWVKPDGLLLSWDGGSRWWRWFRQKSEDRMLESLGSVCRLEMMEVVQAEVWEPVVVISDWGRDPWDGGVWCRTPGYWELCGGLRSLVPAEESGWMVWLDCLNPFQPAPISPSLLCARSFMRARSLALDFYSPCYSLLLEYKYRMIHGLCQEKIQCLLLGGFSFL